MPHHRVPALCLLAILGASPAVCLGSEIARSGEPAAQVIQAAAESGDIAALRSSAVGLPETELTEILDRPTRMTAPR